MVWRTDLIASSAADSFHVCDAIDPDDIVDVVDGVDIGETDDIVDGANLKRHEQHAGYCRRDQDGVNASQ